MIFTLQMRSHIISLLGVKQIKSELDKTLKNIFAKTEKIKKGSYSLQ